jgi:hypothetical protein
MLKAIRYKFQLAKSLLNAVSCMEQSNWLPNNVVIDKKEFQPVLKVV